MLNVLLVEPKYKNKYPPMGLMKISTYHKNRGDKVQFIKGKNEKAACCIWDRIYITTLFTFDYDLVVDTIRYYKKFINHVSDLYVGGILASLMPSQIKRDAGIENVITGQLISSSLIGFDDDVNIDCLYLDYDILNDIDFSYSAGDNYLAYTTRGCPNTCAFCAVPKLEPQFKTENHILELVKHVDENFGAKRNLLLLDNNVLNSTQLPQIVEDIKSAGFTKEATFVQPILFDVLLKKVYKYPEQSKYLDDLFKYLFAFKKNIPYPQKRAEYLLLVETMYESNDPLQSLQENKANVLHYLEKYKDKRPKRRFVDFNQGLDARLLDEEKMALLAQLPIRPLRIAFDSLSQKENYQRVVRLAAQYNIKDISNYILYNFTDKPEELWERLRINVSLREDLGVDIFSFPMKYIPVNRTNRDYVGRFWNKKQLSAITAILLVTKGIVAHGRSFFYKAFGQSVNEYFEILAMPRDFIIYRKDFEQAGLTSKWRECYMCLGEEQRKELMELVDKKVYLDFGIQNASPALNRILKYYSIKHSDIGAFQQLHYDFVDCDSQTVDGSLVE